MNITQHRTGNQLPFMSVNHFLVYVTQRKKKKKGKSEQNWFDKAISSYRTSLRFFLKYYLTFNSDFNIWKSGPLSNPHVLR